MYHKLLVDNSLTKRVLIDKGLAIVMIDIDHTRILIDVRFAKSISRCRLCKRVLVDDGLLSTSRSF